MTSIQAQALAEPLVSECGRRIRVSAHHTHAPSTAASRVALEIAPESPEAGVLTGSVGTWAELTPQQARRLAMQLLDEAARAEHPPGKAHLARGTVLVEPADARAWTATAGGRHLFTTTNGPVSLAATSAEMLAAAAAVCIAARAGQFLAARGIERDRLVVTAGFTEESERPARVLAIRIRVDLPRGLDAHDQDGLRRELARSTVTNTLRQPPHLTVELR